MPKNTTAAAPLAPMDPDDIISAFTYIRAMQARDVDTACAVVEDIGGSDMRQLLLDVAERVIIPVTTVDDRNRDLSADSFVVQALGRMILDILRVDDDICPAMPPGIAHAIIRFTEEILTEDQQDVADVLQRLQAAGVEQAVQVYGPPIGIYPAGVYPV
ncbi:hypothetical protein [Streptomyces sp. NPDC006463]|uniref:hypothetical protein n=1 Tax=Streptomyces sp. NPDC006463 TaxID=3364746 RepID=UPI0036755DF3